MRYLVVRLNADGTKTKLARFAYNCDAQRFSLAISEEPETPQVDVLDTKLKIVSAVSKNGVCTFHK